MASSLCPNPRTCDHYELAFENSAHWEIGQDGIARIPYFINPTQPWLPEETTVAAIRASTKTWEDWNPSLRFEYQGTTTALPGPPGIRDGLNVIGFMTGGPAATVCCTNQEHVTEFDIMLGPQPWTWTPCDQANDSCTPVCRQPPSPLTSAECSSQNIDLQSIVVHELGHAIGLADLEEREYCHLTMWGGITQGCDVQNNRMAITLGRGDVLGAKALYPWECPPLVPGGQYPVAYRNICPTITVYAP